MMNTSQVTPTGAPDEQAPDAQTPDEQESARRPHRIGVIGGDGIGPEVTAQALRVLEAAGLEMELTHYDLGAARYLRDGTVLPDPVMEEWRRLDALLL
ncbi:MAG: isocitrate/isopropylmalate family dehydrogenase, partial [Candidatus Microthrix subdominans]